MCKKKSMKYNKAKCNNIRYVYKLKFWWMVYLDTFQYLPKKICLLMIKRKMSKFWREKAGKHHLSTLFHSIGVQSETLLLVMHKSKLFLKHMKNFESVTWDSMKDYGTIPNWSHPERTHCSVWFWTGPIILTVGETWMGYENWMVVTP